MIIIPQARRIALIATSLFITTFSLVLFVVGGQELTHGTLAANTFGNFSESGEQAKNAKSYMEGDFPVIALDSAGKVVNANSAFEKSFGYIEKDVASKSFYSFLGADDFSTFASDLSTVMTTEKILVNAGPFHLNANDGKSHIVLVTFTVVTSENQKEKITVLTIKDISDSLNGAKNDGSSGGKAIKDLDDTPTAKNRIIVEKTV